MKPLHSIPVCHCPFRHPQSCWVLKPGSRAACTATRPAAAPPLASSLPQNWKLFGWLGKRDKVTHPKETYISHFLPTPRWPPLVGCFYFLSGRAFWNNLPFIVKGILWHAHLNFGSKPKSALAWSPEKQNQWRTLHPPTHTHPNGELPPLKKPSLFYSPQAFSWLDEAHPH